MAQKKKGKGKKKGSKKSKKSGSDDNKMKIIAIIVIAVVVVALIAFLLLGGDDDGNGDNGNGNQKPFADFEYTPEVIYVNYTVNFDASNSTDLDDDELEYTWDFGDEYADSGNPNTDSGVTASHIYTVTGEYDVKLIVDDGKLTDEKILNITVLPEETPSVSVTIINIDDTLRNIKWTITVDAVVGTDEQLALSNIRFNIYNGTDTNDVKHTGLVSALGPPDNIPPFDNDNDIYFDNIGESILSVGDKISIAGDGNVGIQDGDYFQLIYEPNHGDMMTAESLL
jgi:PKD repeat protein